MVEGIEWFVFARFQPLGTEKSGDLVDRGMTLTGGCSLLAGLGKSITEITGIRVRIAPNAKKASAEGAGRMLDDFKFYSKYFVEDLKSEGGG